jgi:arylsulfatase A-like enzyme
MALSVVLLDMALERFFERRRLSRLWSWARHFDRPERRRAGPAIVRMAVLAGAVIAVALWPSCRAGPQEDILLIVIDTVRADDFGCYGSTRGATPNVDSLAADAVRFDEAFGHAPWTLPSISSLLTSTYPSIHGALGKQWRFQRFTGIRDGIASGAQALKGAGFATHAIVNAVFLDPDLGLSRGFDEYDIDYATNYKIRRAGPSVDLALEYLKKNRDRRDFLLLHLFDPHLRYDPPPGWADRFIGTYTGRLKTMPAAQLDHLTGRMIASAFVPPGYDQAYLANMHLAEVAYVDAMLGRLFAGLKELGLYDSSIIVVTADHGEEFWDHGRFEHGHTLYDELMHLPLIIKPARTTRAGPESSNAERGRVVHETVRQIDIMPTLLELVGVAVPETFEGESFAGALRRDSATLDPRPVYSEEPHYQRFRLPNRLGAPPQFFDELIAWRKDGWKYIVDLSTGKGQLFDVARDPKEADDLAGSEPERAAAMRKELLAFCKALLTRAAALPPAPPFDMHEEYFERLKALGYIRDVPGVPEHWTDTTKLEKLERLEGTAP